MGRPSQKLTEQLRIRITAEEKKQLIADADLAAVDLSTLARAQILNAPIPRRARRKSVDHEALARVLVQLGKIGTNINQLAKIANTSGDLSGVRTTRELKDELSEIRALVRDAIAP